MQLCITDLSGGVLISCSSSNQPTGTPLITPLNFSAMCQHILQMIGFICQRELIIFLSALIMKYTGFWEILIDEKIFLKVSHWIQSCPQILFFVEIQGDDRTRHYRPEGHLFSRLEEVLINIHDNIIIYSYIAEIFNILHL